MIALSVVVATYRRRDTLAVTPSGPKPTNPVAPNAVPLPISALGNPTSAAIPMPVPTPALRTGNPATWPVAMRGTLIAPARSASRLNRYNMIWSSRARALWRNQRA